MDKVARYKAIARQIAEEVGKHGQTANDKVASQLITDDENSSLKYYRDLKNSLDTAFEEGKVHGLRDVVRNGAKKGLDYETLATLTGLSVDEVGQILNDE